MKTSIAMYPSNKFAYFMTVMDITMSWWTIMAWFFLSTSLRSVMWSRCYDGEHSSTRDLMGAFWLIKAVTPYVFFQIVLHSKNSQVRFDPEKSPRGPDPFWGQTYPESRSDGPGIRVRKTFWTQIPVIFTRIPDQSDPGMGLAPWDPFPGQIWPGSVPVIQSVRALILHRHKSDIIKPSYYFGCFTNCSFERERGITIVSNYEPTHLAYVLRPRLKTNKQRRKYINSRWEVDKKTSMK